MKRSVFPVITAMLMMMACGQRTGLPSDSQVTLEEVQRVPGDSAYYGLACDGSTDSILIVLPLTGGDPDTFDILNALLNRRVLGHPSVGDMITVVRDTAIPFQASMVVNLSRLKGEWCYQVTPRLRLRHLGDSMKHPMPALPDSLRRRWLQPREYGFEIRRDHSARPIGNARRSSSDKQSPVVYPSVKQYRKWQTFNGRLILIETSRETLRQHRVVSSDTAEILLLHHDSLRLRFRDAEQSYYRKGKVKL